MAPKPPQTARAADDRAAGATHSPGPLGDPSPGPSPSSVAGPQPLILPAPEIVDIDALNEAIAAAAQEASAKGGDAAEIRAAVVPILREAMATGRKTIADAFTARPRAAAEMVRSYTYVTDTMVIATMRIAETWLAPLSPKAQKNPLSLIAVGGYGRGDIAPIAPRPKTRSTSPAPNRPKGLARV